MTENALITALHAAEDTQNSTFNFNHNYEIQAIPQEIKILRPFVQILHIDNCFQLRTLSPAIGDLPLLRWLNVSYNQLTELPMEIAKLRYLERLHCNNNAITSLPMEFWALKNLEELRCESNRIRAIPTGLLFLPKLTQVTLENNPLLTPEEVDGAEPTTLLPAVKVGDCSNCHIRFQTNACFISFHQFGKNKSVPIVHRVATEKCKEHLASRLQVYDLEAAKLEEEATGSPKKSE
jgi:hypothetical protein